MTQLHTPISMSQRMVEALNTPVSPTLHKRAALHLLDWLGCISAASTTEVAHRFAEYGSDGQFAEGRCFAMGAVNLSACGAAFVNGGLGNVLELDDVHRGSILHAGDVVLPAALACAQAGNADSVVLLEAIVCGYEMALRIGQLAASGGYSNWYNSGTCGVFGAAVAAGLLMRLTDDQLVDAIGQAGMLASGVWQCRLESTYSKQLAAAHAAQAGVLAAQLASKGFPGSKFILEGELGFFRSFYPECNLAMLDTGKTGNWLIEEVSFKPWPACRHTHAAIEAALNVREKLPRVDDIQHIVVSSYQSAIDFCDNRNPATDHEARFSFQHCVAVALCRGAPGIADFDQAARADPLLRQLASQTSVAVDKHLQDAFPGLMGAAIEVTLHDGSKLSFTVESALGDPENPLDETALADKYSRLLAFATNSPASTATLKDTVLELYESQPLYALGKALDSINPVNKEKS